MMAATRPTGRFALVLHAHLPYVRHPENRHHLEELWFFEAMTDTYLPLIQTMEGWVDDGVPFRLALSVTPTLLGMMQDSLLQKRYVEHLDRSVALAHREMDRLRDAPHFLQLARMYGDRFKWARRKFVHELGNDLVAALRRLVPHGLELLASAATHGFLPLMEPYRSSVEAQIRTGVDLYRETFGMNPMGFWLPECAYWPGHDEILADHGIRYTIVETHGLLHGEPPPKHGHHAPVRSPAGVAFFARDTLTSRQVWSATEGYPGDFDYREFYRDIGHELPWEEIAGYMPWGVRSDTGFKYRRITGSTEHKAPYVPEVALEKAKVHARDFQDKIEARMGEIALRMERPPIVLAPYDAELFGHWWFEGPWFLDAFVRRAGESSGWSLATPSECLDLHPDMETVAPSASSWGNKGYYEVWLNDANDWIYRHLLEAAERMERLADKYLHAADPLTERALNQAARELMLAQASDWAFIMASGTCVQYAAHRTRTHLDHFFKLEKQIESGRVDAEALRELESRHSAPAGVDFRSFSPRSRPVAALT